MNLDITLDGLPPMNTADRRGRWVMIRAKREWESKVCGAVLMALGRWPESPMKRAHVTITRYSGVREPDFENLTQGGKFLLDGLVKAGVLEDDSPKVIGQPTYKWEPAKRGEGRVRIQVECGAMGELK